MSSQLRVTVIGAGVAGVDLHSGLLRARMIPLHEGGPAASAGFPNRLSILFCC
ncbi:hypothetical protein SAMN05519103_08799 [Rhizobiales bacterium GAS113]|nr:hypothetical protein SAMN05519103_08799 [Rhizobiales bacterium GAS113]